MYQVAVVCTFQYEVHFLTCRWHLTWRVHKSVYSMVHPLYFTILPPPST